MKYKKANNVLPQELINMIQKYVDGEFLYIPRKLGEQKAWGEMSGSRETLKARNEQIYNLYINGKRVEDISMDFYLSEQSIRRIICQEKQKCS